MTEFIFCSNCEAFMSFNYINFTLSCLKTFNVPRKQTKIVNVPPFSLGHAPSDAMANSA